VDINLSSDDEIVHPPEPDTSVSDKVVASDDTRDVGASSVEPTAPGPIRTGIPEKSTSFTAARVLTVLPSSRGG
jgi:hypothetical protein